MVPAPVGFQCPECVANAAAETRQPTTVAGGRIIDRPVVTYTLIGINAVVFLLEVVAGIGSVSGDWGMSPFAIAQNNEWWRLLTSAFLHGSFLHIAFNMYVLYALGPTLERLLGHTRYITLYVLAALGGSVASYAFSDLNTLSVGASGAIFGLMGALVVAGRRLRYDVTQVLVLLGVNLVIGFITTGVDWRAHLGGLVTGAATAAVFVYAPKANRTTWQVAGIIGIVIVLAAAVMIRTAQITDLIPQIQSNGT